MDLILLQRESNQMKLKKFLKQQHEVNRRSFIIGAGTFIGLPFLESLHFSRFVKAQNNNAPLRVLFGLIDNGLFRYEGNDTKVHPEVMSLLNQLESKRNIYFNLNNSFKKSKKITHYASATCYATGIEDRENVPNSANSFDQIAQQATGFGYGQKSYHISTTSKYSNAPFTGSFKNGRNVSSQYDLIKIYNALVTNSNTNNAPTEKADLMKVLKKGTLHYFMDSINSIKRNISTSDKLILDNHLSTVDDLDRSLADIKTQDIKDGCPNLAKPASNNVRYDKRREILIDIISTAFVCGSTRSMSVSLNDGRSDSPKYQEFLPQFNKLYQKIKNKSHGGDGSYRGASHHQMTHFGNVASAAGISQIEAYNGARAIDNFNIKFFVEIAKKLNGFTEGNGKTVLDNSLIQFGGGLGSAKSHDGDKLPTFSLGSAGGKLQTGIVKDMKNNKLSSLHKSILQAIGCNINSFGNSGTGGVQKSDIAA